MADRPSRVTNVPTIAPAGAISIVPAENTGEGPAAESPESEPQPAAITARLPTTALTPCNLNRSPMSPSLMSAYNIVSQGHGRPIESLTFG